MPDDSRLPDEALRELQREAYASPTAEIPATPTLIGPPPSVPRQRRVWLPFLLFLATCLSTYLVGGWQYSAAVMTILVCHEAGHFIQSWRYGVPASFPYFLPLPLPPIGTLGAVIGMSSRIPNRRALFDIGITGPLAGLVPTLAFCALDLRRSFVAPEMGFPYARQFGEPLLFKLMSWLVHGPIPDGYSVYIGPLGMAGWVGLLITSLNLFPVGQLDGGHVLYSLFRGRAYAIARLVLMGTIVAVLALGYYWWFPMLTLVMVIGPRHPPTAADEQPLGKGRIVLGWLVLAFLPLGFTPNPFAAPPLEWWRLLPF